MKFDLPSVSLVNPIVCAVFVDIVEVISGLGLLVFLVSVGCCAVVIGVVSEVVTLITVDV